MSHNMLVGYMHIDICTEQYTSIDLDKQKKLSVKIKKLSIKLWILIYYINFLITLGCLKDPYH